MNCIRNVGLCSTNMVAEAQKPRGGVLGGEGTAVLRKSGILYARHLLRKVSPSCGVEVQIPHLLMNQLKMGGGVQWGVQNLFQATHETRFKYSPSNS